LLADNGQLGSYHYCEKLALTEAQLFALSIPENRRLFFQSLPQLFHTAIFRKPALDKGSSLHLNCQLFSVRPHPPQPGTRDGKR
jgi:hypothetical protein